MRWRCTWCGREYDAEQSECGTCGRESFEQVSETADAASAFESGSIVWVCTDCGREHVKRSPPCSRCGGHSLEKRDAADVDLEGDITSPGYLTVGKPYLLGIVLVVGLVALVVTGILPFPGVGGPPDPPDAPGDSDRAAGLELGAVETALYERFETEREAAGVSTREFGGGGTDAYIEYRTRHWVAERYDPGYEGSMPDADAFELRCTVRPTVGVVQSSADLDAFETESELAEALADELLADEGVRDAVLGDAENEGIAIHVTPDGDVVVGYLAC